VRNLRQRQKGEKMIIIADSLQDLIKKYRDTPNPITGETPLFRDFTDDFIWDSAFEAGKRQAQTNAQQSAVRHQ
jgi:hypothetical protein